MHARLCVTVALMLMGLWCSSSWNKKRWNWEWDKLSPGNLEHRSRREGIASEICLSVCALMCVSACVRMCSTVYKIDGLPLWHRESLLLVDVQSAFVDHGAVYGSNMHVRKATRGHQTTCVPFVWQKILDRFTVTSLTTCQATTRRSVWMQCCFIHLQAHGVIKYR